MRYAFAMRSLVIFYFSASVLAEEYVQKYTIDNFKKNIRENEGTFVMFYAPWCSHCTVFHPTWNRLAELVNTPESNFRIAQVDCTVDANVCREYDITGYPTLLYFKKNTFEGTEYRGTRDLPSLTLFLNEVMTDANQNKQSKRSNDEVLIFKGMAYLTDQNFDKYVSKGQHFIMFYTPWCELSQMLAPTWSFLAEQYIQNESVSISKIDCQENKATCLNFDVRDYPHMIWLVNGKVMQATTGLKSIDQLREFVETMAQPENHNPDRYMKKRATVPIATISEDTFDLYMKQELVFINYFVAWCAHCKLMVPTWRQLADAFLNDTRLVVADVDCGRNLALCVQEDVHNFPTLILYKKSQVIFQHKGSTTLEDLIEEVKKHFPDVSEVAAKDEL